MNKEEKKYYYVSFMEFVVTAVVDSGGLAQKMVTHNFVVIDRHPFIWRAEAIKGKDIKLYNVQITWWKELSREEYELFITTMTGLDSVERKN